MWTELFATSVGIFAGSFSGWFFTRKKNLAETTGIDIANAKELIEMHRSFTVEVKQNNQEVKEEFDRAKKLIKEQQEIIQHFTDKCVQIKHCRLS